MTSKELALKKLSELEKTYRNAPSTSMFSEFMRIYITVDDLAEAVKTLEKQIPKKPYSTEKEGPYSAEFEFGCPDCRFWLIGKTNYCSNCGQRLDWSDGNAEIH